jgi:GH24 family phage-related lysozyme (muramidase)
MKETRQRRSNVNIDARRVDGPTVRSQTAAASLSPAPAGGGGYDALSQSLQSFFGGAQRALNRMNDAELATELDSIDKENKQLAAEGVAAGLAGQTEVDPVKLQRDHFANSYRKALGFSSWSKDSAEFDQMMSQLTPGDDPQAAAQQFLDTKIGKGADPMFEAAYREQGLKHATQSIAKWTAGRQLDVINKAMDGLGNEISSTVSNGTLITPDMYESYVRTVEATLPVGQKALAHDKVQAMLFSSLAGSGNSGAAMFMDTKLANGKTLREMNPAKAAEVDQRIIGQWRQVKSVQADQDLNDIDLGITRYAAGVQGGISPEQAMARLTAHRWEGFGYSDKWQTQYEKVLAALGNDALYGKFKANALGRMTGEKLAQPQSPENWSKYGDRLIADLDTENRAMGLSPEESYRRIGQVIVTNQSIPPNYKNTASQFLTSPNPADRERGYNMLRGVAELSTDETLIPRLMDERSAAVFNYMRFATAMNRTATEAAADSMRIDFKSADSWDKAAIGDNKPETIQSQVKAVTDLVRAQRADTDKSVWRLLPGFAPGSEPDVVLARGLDNEIEASLRKSYGIHAGTGVSDEYVQKQAAGYLASRLEPAYEDGKIVLMKRTSAASRMLDTKSLVVAASQFKEIAKTFGGDGENFLALTPDEFSERGLGYQAQVTIGGVRKPVVLKGGMGFEMSVDLPATVATDAEGFPIGPAETKSELRTIHVPENIPATGWMPEELASKLPGWKFMPHPVRNDYAVLRFVGETQSERDTRQLRELEAQQDIAKTAGTEQLPPTGGVQGALRELGMSPASTRVDRIRGEERRYSSVDYWLGKKTEGVTSYLLDQGLIDPKTFHKTVRPNISSTDDARTYLEQLMSESRKVTRFVDPKDYKSVDDLYSAQRLDLLARVEGKRYQVYDDATGKSLGPNDTSKGYRSVGIGFNMDSADARQDFQKLGINDFDAVYKGERKLSEAEVIALFELNIQQAEEVVSKKLGNVPLSRNQRLALVSMAYNHPDLLGPNLVGFIRSGDMDAAAQEILERSNKKKDPGLQNRREIEGSLFKGVLNAG